MNFTSLNKYKVRIAFGVLLALLIATNIDRAIQDAKYGRLINEVRERNEADRQQIIARGDSLYAEALKRLYVAEKALQVIDSTAAAREHKYNQQLIQIRKQYEKDISRIDSLNAVQLKQLLSELAR